MVDVLKMLGPDAMVSVKTPAGGVIKQISDNFTTVVHASAFMGRAVCSLAKSAEKAIEESGVTLKKLSTDPDALNQNLIDVLYMLNPDGSFEVGNYRLDNVLIGKDSEGRTYLITLMFPQKICRIEDLQIASLIIRINGYYNEALTYGENRKPYWELCVGNNPDLDYTHYLTEEQTVLIKNRTAAGAAIMSLLHKYAYQQKCSIAELQAYIDKTLSENELLLCLAESIENARIGMYMFPGLTISLGVNGISVREKDGKLQICSEGKEYLSDNIEDAKRIISEIGDPELDDYYWCNV